MHVVLVGTYPPTSCGIATFTADVESSLQRAGVRVTIVPVSTDDESVQDGLRIRRDVRSTYAAAAAKINRLGCDVVLIEHEFGIFGGVAGDWLLDFVDELNAPTAVTLHTVLTSFNDDQRRVVDALLDAAVVTVFTETARDLLVAQFPDAAASVSVLAHGAPIELYRPRPRETARRRFGLPSGSPIISTFGLLSPGKGIEFALRALADDAMARVHYVIAGRTHPEIVRRDGEQYRQSLIALVDELGLGRRVTFIDAFLSIDDLAALLTATDVFCTPYVGEEQSVSGAMSFALAAGCPVVSTPYRYAQDVLSGGAGLLVPYGDVGALSTAMHGLCFDDQLRWRAVQAARAFSRSVSWPNIGRQLHDLLDQRIAIEASMARAG
jgi:glycosyltransferase involved in cell wall biosynthesis